MREAAPSHPAGAERRTARVKENSGEIIMLWTIVAVLLILWLLGFSLHVAGGLIHLLLVVALIVVVVNLLSGRRAL
jgi:di/tricarboxylate transporter